MISRVPVRGTTCLAWHIPAFKDGGTVVHWREPSRRFSRVRVVAWTCYVHRVTWYELCEFGGLSFIRRTADVGDTRSPVVSESQAWPRAEARAVWVALLAGRAR
ncbi:hypothetical protein AB0B89_16840 [Sphaerisporangium sp. NPDC049002]|uniref:hypothetical protein n=1 Tax=Sphaerisporangium sp. NPDC049002 TaxID=3155392 RepID=UPI003405C24E